MNEDTSPPGSGIDASLTEALAKIEIPPRPAILDGIQAEMSSEEPDYHHLAHLVVSDAGLAAGLIKTANAPYFGYRTKARTVREALTMLGLVVVSRTLAGLALRQALPPGPGLQAFWDTSTRIAHVAGWLVQRLGVRDGVRAQDAHTYGLFRDCGIPVLMRAYEGYRATLDAALAEANVAFTEVEESRHLLNHALVATAMARSWYLPETSCLAILHHHDPALLNPHSELPAGTRRLIALGHVAERLQAWPDDPQDHEWAKMGEACLAALELSPQSLAGMAPEARELLNSVE